MSKILVTGGLGFIGSNFVLHRVERGDLVRVLDNGSRVGTELNRAYLEPAVQAGRLEIVDGDVRDCEAVSAAVAGMDAVVHLAAQVAVTTSVDDPRSDFEVNARGTLNVLEAVRRARVPPVVVYASTNKVYGELSSVPVLLADGRWRFEALPYGVGENEHLDFHSPYGCSKGCADQYVIDYARIYGLRTVSLRQSCIYGPFQRGNEDQGWVAHFALQTLGRKPVTIYGDGCQVRDVLYVCDLVELYDRVLESIDAVSGRAYNVGGGSANSVSLHDCLRQLGATVGTQPQLLYDDWRPGDQRVFVSDNRRLERDLGWRPKTRFPDGIRKLVAWLEFDSERLRSGEVEAGI